MTLLELLRQELPKRGGWPEGADYCVQHAHDLGLCWVIFGKGIISRTSANAEGMWEMNYNFSHDVDFCANELASDHATAIVTREQYEATGWDGTGLPPVGCECEYSRPPVEADSFGSAWKRCFIRYASFRTVVIQTHNDELSGHPSNFQFRPLRTEAEQKRGAAVGAIFDVICKSLTDESESTSFAIYDAIAAGKIPGVKLEV